MLIVLLAEACAGGHSASDPAFRADVMPLFQSRDCGRAGCHGPNLVLAGAPEEIYASLITSGVLVFSTNVDACLLLAKPNSNAADVPHAGGKAWSTTDPEYQTLRAWILAGAPDN